MEECYKRKVSEEDVRFWCFVKDGIIGSPG
mgnify:FL=1